MAKDLEEKLNKKNKFFQWILLAVLIPILFVITVALILSTVAGVNVFDAAKSYSGKIPFAGALFQKNASKLEIQTEKEIIQLQAQIKDREAKIDQLQTTINNRENDIQKAQSENSQLQQEIDDLTASQKESKRALKDIISTYETMSPKKSAPIIAKMSDAEALKILTNAKPEILANILENMDPVQAARFTEIMTKNNDMNLPNTQ